MTTRRNAVVIGGGYAGVMAANRLTRREDVDVTVVNPRAQFVERIRLHQLLSQSHAPAHDFTDVLAERVRLVVDTVTRIDPAARRVELAGGTALGYDYLVYAAGSTSAGGQVPGSAEHAHRVGTLEEADRLHTALQALHPGAPVTVVGGGPTAIETAAELAEGGHAVSVVSDGPVGASLHPRARRWLLRRLRRLGAGVLEGAAVLAVTAEEVQLAGGRRLPSALTVWAAGFGLPDLAARSGLSVDAAGRLRTDETLTSLDDDRIVAAGDAAAPSDLPLRMSCQAAVQLGPQAAETVLARIAGQQPRPIGVAFVSLCLSVGRRAGLLQVTRRNDAAVPVHLTGRPGAAVKELICSGTLVQLRFEARHPGRIDGWMTDPGRRRRLAGTRGAAQDGGAAQGDGTGGAAQEVSTQR